MKLAIYHDTRYTYANPVSASIQFLRLTPKSTERQQILEWRVQMPRQVRSQIDPYGNVLHVLTLEEPHSALALSAYGQVEIDPSLEVEHDSQSPLPFLRTSRLTQANETLIDFAVQRCGHRRDRAALIKLMEGLADCMPYSPGATAVDSTAAEAFAAGVGVCQDHTHAFLACARSLGIPARYVSGYLCTRLGRGLAGGWLVQFRRDQSAVQTRSPPETGGGPGLPRRLSGAWHAPRRGRRIDAGAGQGHVATGGAATTVGSSIPTRIPRRCRDGGSFNTHR